MAWRLDEAVIRGEIDNGTRGVVTGKIWLVGRAQPLELELAGNPWRDLAGRRLEFVNPAPRGLPIVGILALRQRGLIGDFTASRRIKLYGAETESSPPRGGGKQETWRWTNGLYLEWFNSANERVLIEAVSYRLTISVEAAWEMTAAEEQRQRALNEATLANHRARLLAAEEKEAYDAEWEQDGAAGGCVEEAPGASEPETARGAAQPEVATVTNTMADVGDALSAGAALIQILDTETARPPAERWFGAVKRLELVKRELDRVRLAVEFCRREKLAETAWADEVQREVRLHAAECERLLWGLRQRLGPEK